METTTLIIQIVFAVGTFYGIYKTKSNTSVNEINDLKERMARIEEKVNFIIQQLNRNSYEKNF